MWYLGIDVSKAKLHTCLLRDGEGKGKTKVVENNVSGIAALLAWTTRQGITTDQLHGVMEATGVYHETAAQRLFAAGVTVSIVNPAQAKDFARSLAVHTKTDGVDSCVLARLGALLQPKALGTHRPRKSLNYRPCWHAGRHSPRTCAGNTTGGKKPWPRPPPSAFSSPWRTAWRS